MVTKHLDYVFTCPDTSTNLTHQYQTKCRKSESASLSLTPCQTACLARHLHMYSINTNTHVQQCTGQFKQSFQTPSRTHSHGRRSQSAPISIHDGGRVSQLNLPVQMRRVHTSTAYEDVSALTSAHTADTRPEWQLCTALPPWPWRRMRAQV